jgi:hypothetical protein
MAPAARCRQPLTLAAPALLLGFGLWYWALLLGFGLGFRPTAVYKNVLCHFCNKFRTLAGGSWPLLLPEARRARKKKHEADHFLLPIVPNQAPPTSNRVSVPRRKNEVDHCLWPIVPKQAPSKRRLLPPPATAIKTAPASVATTPLRSADLGNSLLSGRGARGTCRQGTGAGGSHGQI